MLKLLIVDDERLDMEGLKRQLNWSDFNISEVYVAQNGLLALELIRMHRPDILISDIKMPVISGLQLAEKAIEILPGIKVIFVSGYDDFSYVKSAIKINAYEYILKPIDTEELAASIQKAVNAIACEKRNHEEKHKLENTVNESLPLLRKKFLAALIYGTADKEGLWEEIYQLDIKIHQGIQKVLLVEVDDYKLLKETCEANGLERRLSLLQNLIQNMNSEKCTTEWVQVEVHRIAIILSFLQPENQKAWNADVDDIAQTIISEAKINAELSVTIGVGMFINQLSELHKSYSESVQAVVCKIYEGKGKVIYFVEESETPEEEVYFERIDTELTKCMLNYDTAKVNHLLECLFNRFEIEKINDGKYIQDHCINIISRVQIMLHDVNVKVEDIFGPGVILWDKLMKFETILDIRQWMKNILGVIIDYIRIRNESKVSKIIKDVLHYIEENYQKDISLKVIAERLYYTPNYLGSVFKQEIVQGFSDYLMEYRIKKAAELLQNSAMKVYEIAGNVGYKDIPTFIKNFKSVFGVTPTEYKETRR